MKLKHKLFGAVTVITTVIAPMAAVVACGSTSSSEYAWQEKAVTAPWSQPLMVNKKIAAVVSDPENPRWQRTRTQLDINAKDAGFAVDTNILKSQLEQNNWLSTHLEGYDAWILGATDDGIATAIQSAGSKNIPVIAYDRLINVDSSNYNWYVTYDNSGVGRLQGIALINGIYGTDIKVDGTATDADITTAVTGKQLSEDAYVAALGGDPADNNAQLFFNGGANVINLAIQADSHLKWVAGSSTFDQVANPKWDYAAGQTKLTTALQKINIAQLKGVLSPNDGMATSAINAIRSNKGDPTKIYITGQDCNDTALTSIYDEKGQNMTIFKPDTRAARLAVAMAAELIAKPDATKDDMLAFLKLAYPGIDPSSYKYDDTSYSLTVGSKKTIHTILLSPTVIDKANIDTYYDHTKA